MSKNKKFDAIVFIGRFQPPTKAHFHIIKKALEMTSKLIVIVGSDKIARSIRDPFIMEERISMLKNIDELDQKRIIYIPVLNSNYDFPSWIEDVQKKVAAHTSKKDKIGIIGHKKDRTSYYLNYFPKWQLIKQDNLFDGLSATDIRNSYFSSKSYKENKGLLKSTVSFLNDFSKTKDYKDLKSEYDFIQKFKKAWSKTPSPVIFSTVHCVLLCKDNILLIKRASYPGKNLLAMPGGLINENETLNESILNKINEIINTDMDTLKNSIKIQQTFDDPHRDLRGRFITQASLIDLKSKKLPEIKKSKDTREVLWLPLNKLESIRDHFFSDHYQIIMHLINKI